MLEDGLLLRYYVSVIKWHPSNRQVAKLLKTMAHKEPREDILEIGGGTDGSTQALLDTLVREDEFKGGGALFSRYDFTDMSLGFFEEALRCFKGWKDLMIFRDRQISTRLSQNGIIMLQEEEMHGILNHAIIN
ncbi:lovF protein [Colletotrichum tofieldiae]|nr:lovF protein [Colletotrichum tofieldiae]